MDKRPRDNAAFHKKQKNKKNKKNKFSRDVTSANPSAQQAAAPKHAPSSVGPTAETLRQLRGTAKTSERPQVYKGAALAHCCGEQGRRWIDGAKAPASAVADLLRVSYRGFACDKAGDMPTDLHSDFDDALTTIGDAGLYRRDMVQAGGTRGALSRTLVTRTLVGVPGITYKYLGLRIFAHPWCDGDGSEGQGSHTLEQLGEGVDQAGANALRKIGELNRAIKQRAETALGREFSGRSCGSCDFNLTLINCMSPAAAAAGGGKGDDPNAKPEPLFGMGPCAVSWHADSDLVDFSTIGVYTKVIGGTSGEDWKVAMRIPEDNVTPAVACGVGSGDLYFLLDDFNHHHQHAVLAGGVGSGCRYSSTHRVAKSETHTYRYIARRCKKVIESGSKVGPQQTKSEQVLLDELEFEWLRQWYIQGNAHAADHPWWHQPMQMLQQWWAQLEERTDKAIDRLAAAGSSAEGETLVGLLEARAEARRAWGKRGKDRSWRGVPQAELPMLVPLASAEDAEAQAACYRAAVTSAVKKAGKKKNKSTDGAAPSSTGGNWLALKAKSTKSAGGNWANLQKKFKK